MTEGVVASGSPACSGWMLHAPSVLRWHLRADAIFTPNEPHPEQICRKGKRSMLRALLQTLADPRQPRRRYIGRHRARLGLSVAVAIASLRR